MRHYHHGPCTPEDPACAHYMGLADTEDTTYGGTYGQPDTPTGGG